jgi:hypothetical protein
VVNKIPIGPIISIIEHQGGLTGIRLKRSLKLSKKITHDLLP